MPLQLGTRIGGYEIVSLLGAGGMGEVYRSRDVRLGRDVAIKIVSPRIAADADAVARFEREARALAALNHPNIAAIYDVIEHGQQPALVLELVEGDTLADRIAAKPLSIAETLHVARQLTDALDTAHEAGIVHRDLKPANIKITEAGQVKILDFGLAKAIAVAAGQGADLDPANTPTITVHGTGQGVILGTAAYMSPEQARGKRIDKRTDIWAFGCVLFEMLAGTRAFDGETTSDVIAAIIERSPDLTRLRKDTPASVRRVIVRCLDKDPKRRARDIAEVRNALDDDAPAVKTASTPQWRALAVGAALVAVIGAVGWYGAGRRDLRLIAPAEAEFVVPLSGVTNPADSWGMVASPDGRRLAFVTPGNDREPVIWIRSLHSATPTPLAGTEGVAGQVFWSPDGRHLGFRAGGRLKRVPVDGGPVQVICPLSVHLGATWGTDDVIVLAPANRTGLSRVPAGGGTLEPVTKIDPEAENSHRWPHFLPDGRHFIFTVRTDRGINNALRLGSLDSADTTVLVESQSNAVYADGYLLYVKDGALLAHPFDAATLKLHGSARAVAGPVLQNTSSAVAAFSASADGRLLAYVVGPRPPARLIWFDRAGKALSQVGAEQIYLDVVLSHDERRALYATIDADYGTQDIWVIDIASGAATRVTNHPATDWNPSWSPDDSEIVFASDRAGHSTIFKTASDGSGEAQLVYRGDTGVFSQEWLPDGRLLFFRDVIGDVPRSLMAVRIGGQAAPETVLSLPFTRINGTVSSRDGRWLAYTALEPGGPEVYVTSISGGQRFKVSTQGGVQPAWRRDGRELFFATPQGDIMSVTVSPGPAFSQPVRLMRPCETTAPPSAFRVGPAVKTFDASGDGQRMLAICESVSGITNVTVALGWQSRLAAER